MQKGLRENAVAVLKLYTTMQRSCLYGTPAQRAGQSTMLTLLLALLQARLALYTQTVDVTAFFSFVLVAEPRGPKRDNLLERTTAFPEQHKPQTRGAPTNHP